MVLIKAESNRKILRKKAAFAGGGGKSGSKGGSGHAAEEEDSDSSREGRRRRGSGLPPLMIDVHGMSDAHGTNTQRIHYCIVEYSSSTLQREIWSLSCACPELVLANDRFS